MKKTIHTVRRGIIHYVATCDCCGEQWCMMTKETPSELSVRNAAKSHVRKTGHSVTVEGGTSTTYSVSS